MKLLELETLNGRVLELEVAEFKLMLVPEASLAWPMIVEEARLTGVMDDCELSDCKLLIGVLIDEADEPPALGTDDVNELNESLEAPPAVSDCETEFKADEDMTLLLRPAPFNEAIERLTHAAFPQLKGNELVELRVNVIDEEYAFSLLR